MLSNDSAEEDGGRGPQSARSNGELARGWLASRASGWVLEHMLCANSVSDLEHENRYGPGLAKLNQDTPYQSTHCKL